MVMVCIVGMMGKSMMDNLVKTSDMVKESLHGPMVSFMMEDLSMDNEKRVWEIHVCQWRTI
jgi:hypothetical protein